MTYYKFYHYDPSVAAACIFALIFGILTVWHVFLIYKHRTWYFIPVVIGGIFEIVGYGARAVSHQQAPNLTLGPYVIQTLLLLVAPPLFAASIYMTLGRIVIVVDAESYSLIKTRWLTKVFVTSDVVTLFVQLAGAGLMASTTVSTSEEGSHIVLAGLFIQIIIFGFFVVVTIVFQRRLRAKPTPRSNDPLLPWVKFLYILYATCFLVMIRSIMRVAEFVEGFEGSIILHEVYLYVLDAVPMVAVMFTFSVWYPSQFSKMVRKSVKDSETAGSIVELESA